MLPAHIAEQEGETLRLARTLVPRIPFPAFHLLVVDEMGKNLEKTYLNALTALSPGGGRLPIHLPSDREALDLTLGHVGSSEPAEQRIVWIRNTLSLDRIAISAPLAREATALPRWRLSEGAHSADFDADGNLNPLLHG